MIGNRNLGCFIENCVSIFGSSLYNKLLLVMVVISVLPLGLLGSYTLYQTTAEIRQAVESTKQALIQSTLNLQHENLKSQATLINSNFEHIMTNVQIIQSISESLFNNPDYYNKPDTITNIIRDPQRGYYMSTPEYIPGIEVSNVFISNKTVSSSILLDEIERSKHLEPVMQRFVSTNPNVVAVYFLFKESVVRIYPKLNFRKQIDENLFPADFDVQSYEFYYGADLKRNPGKKINWTRIYRDITDRGLMITCNAPVYLKSGELRGVIGVDITLKNLINNVLNIKFEQNGTYAALITSSGEVISNESGSYPDRFNDIMSKVGNSVLGEIIQDSAGGGSGIKEIISTDENKYVLYGPIGHTGWTLAYIIPVQEITMPVENATRKQIINAKRNLLVKIGIGTISFLILAVLFSTLLSAYITKPVKNLTKGVIALGEGTFDHEVQVNRNDEIGILSNSFNKMASQLKEMVLALEQKAQEQLILNANLAELNRDLENKVSERTAKLRETNENLQEALENIRAVEKSRRELLANVSHEVRTPLMMIQGYVEALHDGFYKDEKEFNQCLEIISQNTNRLNRLISDLSDLSQLEARQQMNFKKVGLSSILYQYFEEISVFLEHEGINFAFKMDRTLPQVYADTDRIIQVLNNLVHNAVKYTPAGGKIHISITAASNGVQIEVADSGLGIHEEDLPYVFTRFFKGQSGQNHRPGNGAGLGLAIVKAIIEAHRGAIWVESGPGEGSRFHFFIPSV